MPRRGALLRRKTSRPSGPLNEPVETIDLQLQLAEAKAAIYVPGCWRCAKCGFELTKSLLGARTGNIAPDMAQHVEPCPNDGEPMERVTWKGDAMRLADRFTERMQRERALSELFEHRAKVCRRRAANMARLVSPDGKPDWAEQYWIGRAEAWEIAAINLQQSNHPI